MAITLYDNLENLEKKKEGRISIKKEDLSKINKKDKKGNNCC